MDFYNGFRKRNAMEICFKKFRLKQPNSWSLNWDTYYNHIQSSSPLLSYTHTLPFPSLSEAPRWPQQPPAPVPR